MNKLISIFLLLLSTALLVSCASNFDRPYDSADLAMGTVITQKIYGKNAKQVAREAITRVKQLESLMTVYTPGGEIHKLNTLAGQAKVKLSPESMYVLKKSLEYATLSNGAFNVMVGPLSKRWRVTSENPSVPTPAEIKKLLTLIDYKGMKLYEKESSAKLAMKGQIVDLGGIAKGFAGDEIIKIYKEKGIKSAFINVGGNIVALGYKPDGTSWNIGIQHPREKNGTYIGTVRLANKAIATSGDYERFFMKGNKRYHHIFDPKTGYPSESDLMSVTIIADQAIDADALSTATFVLGLKKGLRLIDSIKGINAIFITGDKKIYITEGLTGSFALNANEKEFELLNGKTIQ
ncbi:MAG TPA: FAD:protein FMN transferase [Candidatus Margulisbacteria bacterium]|nr:MAG: thiamine biosynthesis protein ApbE [Candidatus Margulisbacteria bacterium GWD2_39_127]HAR63519.1 FAD:protein FMN transferase [Candidatus Margulisiibacteriota bacterium]